MRSAGVVEAEIPADRGASLGDRVVSSEVDLLVLDRSPEPLDEDVVAPGTLAVHADGDPVPGQHTGEGPAGELAALIGVEDLRPAVAGQGLFQRLGAERRLHGDRQPPAENPTAEPVDDRGEVDEPARHRNVGDVHGPDLVGPGDRQVAQQVGVDLVARCRLRGVGPAVDRLDTHALHQRGDMPTADRHTLGIQEIAQHPAAREREVARQLVTPAHDREIGRAHGARPVIDAAPADVQSSRLAGDGQLVRPVDHRLALSSPALLSAPSKKSFVSVSSPILAWRVLTSTGGAPRSVFSDPNTPAAPSRSSALQAVIWFGWTSNCCASSASVFSPLMAARATFALKAGLWFRRDRRVIVSPARQPSWPLSGRNATYRPVRIRRASSEYRHPKDPPGDHPRTT